MPFDPFRGFKTASDIARHVSEPQREERELQNKLRLYRQKKDIDREDYDGASMVPTMGDSAMDNFSVNHEGNGGFPEDYITRPIIRNVRGIPTRMNIRELKPIMQEAASKVIRAGRVSSRGLASNLGGMTPDIERRMGPPQLGHLSAIKGGIGDTILNFQSVIQGDKGAKDFAAFKSQSDIIFQQWRQFITGVQAAFPEIKMLEPDYPQPTDTPEIYKEKALKLMEQAQEVEDLILSTESQRGFRTGDLRQGGISQNPLVQGILKKHRSSSIEKKAKTRTGMGYSMES